MVSLWTWFLTRYTGYVIHNLAETSRKLFCQRLIYKASVDYFLDFLSLYVFHLVTVDCVSEKWSVIVRYPMVPPSFSTNVYLNVLMPIAATSAICVVWLLLPIYEIIPTSAADVKIKLRWGKNEFKNRIIEDKVYSAYPSDQRRGHMSYTSLWWRAFVWNVSTLFSHFLGEYYL